MNWTQIIEVIGGTTVVVAAIAWVAKSTISHFFSRELEKSKIDIQAEHNRKLADLKHEQAKELESLRASQQEVLADIQAKAEERLEHVRAALGRVERLEADLVKSRGEGYGEIWKFTGSLNLFGPITKVDNTELSNKLKDWYFEHGWVLTQESKRRYFLVQEVLNFGMLQSISFRRPTDEQLFSSQLRPVEVLRQLRSKLLKVEVRGDEGMYTVDELETCVSAWKSQVLKKNGQEELEELAEEAWVLLQFVLSAFRTGVVEELGSRERIHKATYPA
jgi:hypothetical protein